jgi:hypothetical protein
MEVIEIPKRLEAVLAKDRALHGAVLSSLVAFEPWLRLSNMPFFPEYTDHTPRHVSEVMATAGSLIQDDAWSVLTPADAATLILAILTHDSAMHLTEDGFLSLIGSMPPVYLLPADGPWDALWSDFVSEASRFDARKLTSLFGSAEPIHPPPQSPSMWRTRDRLLIGEFVRRHHARLAHEIAVLGVPGPTGQPLKLGLCAGIRRAG